MKLFESTPIPSLSTAMDAYALRQKAIASNIANIGSSGYAAKKVRFEEDLANADAGLAPGMDVSRTNDRHLSLTQPTVTPAVEEVKSEGIASGVNDVDIDQEMADLAKNQIRYKFSARLIGDTFRELQKSIKGTV